MNIELTIYSLYQYIIILETSIIAAFLLFSFIKYLDKRADKKALYVKKTKDKKHRLFLIEYFILASLIAIVLIIVL